MRREEADGFGETAHTNGLDPINDGSLGGVVSRDDDTTIFSLGSEHGQCQCSFDSPDSTVQGHFAHDDVILEAVTLDLLSSGHQGDGDG